MDRRRRAVILLAIIFAGIGTVLLVAGVRANDDGTAPGTTRAVVVLRENLAVGDTVNEIRSRVEVDEIPEDLVHPRALRSLEDLDRADLADLVAGVEMFTGEQLLRDRLVPAVSLTRVEVPRGLQELTLALEPERALGATLRPGDLVGVAVSISGDDLEVGTSRIVAHGLVVTAVAAGSADRERVGLLAGSDSDSGATETETGVTEAPRDEVLVTLAVSTAQAETLVHAAIHGDIWLLGQDAATDVSGGAPRTSSQILGVDPVVAFSSEVAS